MVRITGWEVANPRKEGNQSWYYTDYSSGRKTYAYSLSIWDDEEEYFHLTLMSLKTNRIKTLAKTKSFSDAHSKAVRFMNNSYRGFPF